MKTLKILLFDMCPESGLGDKLQTMMNHGSRDDTKDNAQQVQFVVQRCRAAEKSKAAALLAEVLDKFKPGASFFILGSHLRATEESLVDNFGHWAKGNAQLFAALEKSSPGQVYKLYRGGMNRCFIAPLQATEIIPCLWQLADRIVETDEEVAHLKELFGLQEFIGEAHCFLAEIRKIPKLAQADITVLVSGESGTGKEVCAQALHRLSRRSGGPFMAINCGAIPADLVENELFGHETGAYTGATSAKKGAIQQAEGGTLFLDEIHGLSIGAQLALLRFLQDKQYRPLGTQKTQMANVRVIAATNSNPEEAVRAGRLRHDLLYRLAEGRINLPPLRERGTDIIRLCHHFRDKFAVEFDRAATNFSTAALRKLMAYSWPGNIRELENIIKRAVLIESHSVIDAHEIDVAKQNTAQEPFHIAKAKAVTEWEQHYLKNVLLAYQGNISQAARAAGKDRRAFWEILRKHNLRAPCCVYA